MVEDYTLYFCHVGDMTQYLLDRPCERSGTGTESQHIKCAWYKVFMHFLDTEGQEVPET